MKNEELFPDAGSTRLSADGIADAMKTDNEKTDTTTVILRAVKLNFDLVAIGLIVIATFILSWAFWTASAESVAAVFVTLVKGLCGFAALWVTIALKVRTPPGRLARKKMQQLAKPEAKLDGWGRTVIR